VALVELGVWNCGTFNNSFVVAKHATYIMHRDAEVMECGTEIDNLINTHMGGNELRTISGSLSCSLFLGIPIKEHLVCKMKNAHGNVGSGDSNGEQCGMFVENWGRDGAKVGSATGVSNSRLEGDVGMTRSVGRRT
jgi:hypothetical protein